MKEDNRCLVVEAFTHFHAKFYAADVIPPPPFSLSSQADCCFISRLPGPVSRKSRNFGCHNREVPAGFVFLVVSTTQVEVT